MMRQIAALEIVAMFAAAFVFETSTLLCAAEPVGAPVPATPPFASPDIKPTLCDWLTARPIALAKKIALTDPLQKPPFVGQAPDSLKGMAAGIRAVQLDAPNRAKAAAYLGTVDCVTYPQAQAMLIATMEEDPAEEVRYEAVMALRMMMSRGCSNLGTQCECKSCRGRKSAARETEKHSKKIQHKIVHEAKGMAKIAAWKANRTTQETRYDCCRGCCNAKVLKALAEVAYGKDDECCFVEPSERVRQAAAEGLSLCTTYPDDFSTVSPVPSAVDGVQEPEEIMPKDDKEVVPDVTAEPGVTSTTVPPLPSSSVTRTKVEPVVPASNATSNLKSVPVPARPAPVLQKTNQVSAVLPNSPAAAPASTAQSSTTDLSGTKTHPAIPALNGYCIVGLKDRQFNRANSQYSSIFEDRTYYFASLEAKEEFDADPSLYAPAYGGVDPVVWLERHEIVEGRYLREFDGRFYLFVDKEMWEMFKSKPQRFVLNLSGSSRNLAGR